MKTYLLSLSLLLALTCLQPGCSSFSKSSRQQRAYEKYVHKTSANRNRQRSIFHSDKPAMPVEPMPSEPVEKSEASASGPEAVPPNN